MNNNWLPYTLAAKRTPCPWCEAMREALVYGALIAGLVVFLLVVEAV